MTDTTTNGNGKTFRLVDWARDEKLDPRHVRSIARAHKDEIAKLQVKGEKYVFADKSRAAVSKIIHDAMSSSEKPAKKAKKKK